MAYKKVAPWRGKPCSFGDCAKPNYGKGLCRLHYGQKRAGARLGDPIKPGPKNGSAVSYGGAHERVSVLWGPASRHECVECGVTAKDWAYDGTDPTQLYGKSWASSETWSFYSAFPEFYMPMCARCHRRRDSAIVRRELHEYRSWKYRTGKTLAEIEGKL